MTGSIAFVLHVVEWVIALFVSAARQIWDGI